MHEFLKSAPENVSFIVMAKEAYNKEKDGSDGVLAVNASNMDVSKMICNCMSHAPNGLYEAFKIGLVMADFDKSPMGNFLNKFSSPDIQ